MTSGAKPSIAALVAQRTRRKGAPYTPNARLVAAVLADLLSIAKGAEAFGYVATLCDRTGLADRTVRRALAELCDGPVPVFARRFDWALRTYRFSLVASPADFVEARDESRSHRPVKTGTEASRSHRPVKTGGAAVGGVERFPREAASRSLRPGGPVTQTAPESFLEIPPSRPPKGEPPEPLADERSGANPALTLPIVGTDGEVREWSLSSKLVRSLGEGFETDVESEVRRLGADLWHGRLAMRSQSGTLGLLTARLRRRADRRAAESFEEAPV
jgi:hypothetical protein